MYRFLCGAVTATAICVLPMSSALAQAGAEKCVDYRQAEPHVHVVSVDLSCKNVSFVGSPEGRGPMTTTQFAQMNNVQIAINGNFFKPSKGPLGLVVTNGRQWAGTKDEKQWTYLACDSSKHCEIEAPDQVSLPRSEWETAVSGWQVFADGIFSCPRSAGSGCAQNNGNQPHPRTAIGLNAQETRLYIVMVEGRINGYAGVTLDHLASIFSHIGVAHGLNLDGGGSSALVIDGRRVSRLPANQREERSVANHFGIQIH